MTDQDYQSIPIAEARAAVLASGEREALAGPFYITTAGATPEPYFIATDEVPHPVAGFVTIKRKGHEARDVWIPWGEYAEELRLNDPEWLEKRDAKPMSIFGAEIERHAYRAEFADVLAAAMPLRSASAPPLGGWDLGRDRMMIVPDAPSGRDWHADLAAAQTVQDVDALFSEARGAKALQSAELHEAFTRRLQEIVAKPATVDPPVEPVKPAGPSPRQVAAVAKPLTAQPPRRKRRR